MADPRPAGTIYDLGHQHYTGRRRGRSYAFGTLFAHSFRTAFGQGRGQRAQQVPALVSLLVVIPAVIQVGIAGATGRPEMINYAQQLALTSFFLALFTAAQAPELIVADRENGTLSLYLSRSLHSTDYAIAKLFALAAALLALTLGPQLVMFGGKVLLSATPWDAFKGEWTKLMPMAGGTLLAAFYMAAVGLSLASLAVKRNSASAFVISFFVVLPAVSGVAFQIARGDTQRFMALINPFTLMSGFATWLFDAQLNGRMVRVANLSGSAYAAVVAATCVVAIAGLLARYWTPRE